MIRLDCIRLRLPFHTRKAFTLDRNNRNNLKRNQNTLTETHNLLKLFFLFQCISVLILPYWLGICNIFVYLLMFMTVSDFFRG